MAATTIEFPDWSARIQDFSGAIASTMNSGIDRVIEFRDGDIQAAVDKAASSNPEATSKHLANHFIRKTRQELVLLGGANGGLAAVPGVGTASSLAMSAADLALTVERIGELILKIGYAYGHNTPSLEERRAWILTVLAASMGFHKGASELAGALGKRGGVKVVKAIPYNEIVKLNRKLGGRIIVKWGTKQGVVRLGRIVPFGIGASIGAVSNGVLVNGVGRSAKRFFDDRVPTDGGEGTPVARTA